MESWSGPENARLYDRWARRFPMYRQTSADLVRVAGLASGESVVDLCCGTGITTEEALKRLGPDGRVFAVDGSREQLEVAKQNVRDQRVRFVCTPAESFHLAIAPASADAVVCNSAFWQTDNVQALASARRVLRENGRLAFNLGGGFFQFDEDHSRPIGNAAPLRDSPLNRRMVEIAVDEYGYTLPSIRRLGMLQLRDYAGWETLLADNGFAIVGHEITTIEATPESTYEWLRIPIFSTRLLPGLPYDLKMTILERAWHEVRIEPPEPEPWIHFVAVRR